MEYLNNKEAFKQGAKDALPIGIGYFAVSFALGIMAKNKGLSAFEATVMSLLNNTSAGEFAALEMMGANIPYFELAISQLIINLRYLLMSCALSQKIKPNTPIYKRMIVGFDITDEIFGISIAQKGYLNVNYNYGAMLTSIPGWALGTCLGVILGNVLSVDIVSALNVALYGMFIAIIIPPAKKSKVLANVINISMISSILFDVMPIFDGISSGTKIIILTVGISLLAAILFPIKEDDYEK